MRYPTRRSAVALVFASALYLSFTLPGAVAQSPTQNHAPTAQQHADTKTLLQNALANLQQAYTAIKSADTDKAGHKLRAESAVDNAMNEVRAALKADYPAKASAGTKPGD